MRSSFRDSKDLSFVRIIRKKWIKISGNILSFILSSHDQYNITLYSWQKVIRPCKLEPPRNVKSSNQTPDACRMNKIVAHYRKTFFGDASSIMKLLS